MNELNRLWLSQLKEQYPANFNNARVLEVGSLDINGSIREFFNNCDYMGIDRTPGNDVDVVVEAKDFQCAIDHFDTLVSFSAFEHDPEWRDTVANVIKYIKPDGTIFFYFGAEGNQPHEPLPHKEVPSKEFVSFLKRLGNIEIIDSFFEIHRFGDSYNNYTKGGFCVVGRKL